MQPLEIAQRYFDAWNRRDADAIVDTFDEDGTYSDPAAGEGLTGHAIARYARGLWSAFPDLSFDVVSASQAGDDMVAVQWLMRGTNTGSLDGLSPTGRSVALPGADFIQVDGEKIVSVRGYFDSRAVPDQLGLQVIVQPESLGPCSFGTSVSVQSGKRTKPGAFSITSLTARSKEEIQEVSELSRQIAGDMSQMSGFIGWVAVTVGSRMLTITAWEDAANPKELAQTSTHQKAVGKFLGKELAAGGVTSVWIPDHINARWIRCESCERMMNYETAQGKCECGEQLPEPLPYW